MALPGAGRLPGAAAAAAGRGERDAADRARSRFTADGTHDRDGQARVGRAVRGDLEPRGFAVGEHELGATVTDAAGQTALQTVSVKICKK